nr:ribonuclease H-like domain-containing protein [Tanacetum cinerariifolium]
MSVHGYTDDEYEAASNDSNGTENYQVWSCAMILALEGKNKTGFIDGTCRRSNIDEVKFFSKRAKHVWEELKETYDKVDGSVTFNLHYKINSLCQNGSSIADYYHKLNALWKQFDALVQLPRCTCHAAKDFKKHNQLMKLMQFLMGLDDTYMQIKSNILSRDPLPDVRSAYAIISSEESHKVVSSTGSRPFNVTKPNSFMNKRSTGRPTLLCENYGFNGHTIDRCFKLIGYPPDFGKKNNTGFSNNNQSSQNFNKRFVNNNNVGSSSSSSFSDEQLSKIIALIKDNTVSSHDLVDLIDISKLGIKVSHPNRTEAFITKVGNMILNKDLIVYDVLVAPEYCVSLMSVHKIARDSKFVVAFDESSCYILPQGLREMKLLGTGKQKDELYYFNKGINLEKSNLILNHKASSQSDGSSSSQLNSPTIDQTKDELGHLQGSNGYVSEDEMVATFEEHISNSEGINENMPNRMSPQVVRRYESVSVLPKKYNDYVMASKVKFGLEKFVNYSKLNTKNFCFVIELNKSIEPKSFWEACKSQHWVDAMNKEMDALYENHTWDITNLPSGRKAINGYNQKEGIDKGYNGEIEIYKARYVVKIVTVRCLINLVMQNDSPLFKLDINNAFLYGDLDETVYMALPDGYFDKNDKRSKSDYSLFTKNDYGVFLTLLVYVDDIVVIGNRNKVINTNNGLCLSQIKYCLDLLSDFGLLACKPSATPLEQNLVIANEPSDSDPVLDNITESYLKIALKVLRYLKGSPGKGIHIVKCPSVSLETFVDADRAKCLVTRKSVTGFCLLLNGSLVSWKSKKQNALSKFSDEAEYRAMDSATSETVWVLKILKDLN